MNIFKPYFIIIKSLLYYLFDSLVLWKTPSPQKNQLEVVLLIRQDAIGDFVMWLDTAKEYRELYPSENYRIVLVGNAVWFDLAKGLPYWDEVLPINVKKFKTFSSYRRNTLRKVNSFGAQIAVQPTFSREFYHGDSLVRASNAFHKVSSVGDMSNRNWLKKTLSDRWHTELIPASQEPISELERNTEFFSAIRGTSHTQCYPVLGINKACSPLYQEKQFFVLVPTASLNLKMWSTDNFAELAEKIFQKTSWQGIICGTEEEFIIGDRIRHQCSAPLKNMSGQTSLPELSQLLCQSQLIISNDTGTAHISSAVGTPTVCILGGGHFGRFAPYPDLPGQTNYFNTVYHKMACYGCNWECVYHLKKDEPAPCVSNISVDVVWQEVEKIIEDGKN